MQDEVLRAKGWRRALDASLNALGDNQQGLSTETEEVAKEELADTLPVFARMTWTLAEAMGEAGERAKAMVKEKPALETLPDTDFETAAGRGDTPAHQVLEAVKDQASGNKGQAGGGGPGGQGDGGDGGGSEPGNSRSAATGQLKLLPRPCSWKSIRRQPTFRSSIPMRRS